MTSIDPSYEEPAVYIIKEVSPGLWELKHSAYPDGLRWFFGSEQEAEEKAGIL